MSEMDKLDKVAIIATFHDRVAGIDSFPRLYEHEAGAMRQFKQSVNMPSDYMTFHAPGDFELVKVSEICRDENGNLLVSLTHREVLLTGTAAVDQAMRDQYVLLSRQRENKNAPQ